MSPLSVCRFLIAVQLSLSAGAFSQTVRPSGSAVAVESASKLEQLDVQPQAPSILLILLDDVGFGDTGTFGGPVQTPSLDALAARGLRYNQFHTTAICSPTRAALLSGRNHHRVGFGGFGGVNFPGYDGIWRKSTASVAEILRHNGYSTAAFGKWHNTPNYEITPVGPFDRWPTGLGFEYYYGNMLGMSSQWEPPLWRNTLPVSQPYLPDQGYHLTTDLVDDAIRWVQTQQSLAPGKPFFLYFATEAAHTPHHVPKEWVDRYRGRFDQGWDAMREQTFLRQKKLGVVPTDTQLTPRPKNIPGWASLPLDERELVSRQMEVFAGFVAHTDHELGRLIDVIQEGPGGDNTLIMYIVGDNGDDSAGGRDGTDSLTASHGAQRSLQDQLRGMEQLGGPLSNTNHYANGWAWAGSTPFRWMKYAASHLGGTRNPLVVSWPARIRGGGGIRSQFTHVVDVVPTLLEVSDIQFPSAVDGVEQMRPDGISFAYTFDNPSAPSRHRVQYFEAVGNRAIYKDGWIASALHTNPLRWPDAVIPSKDFDRDRWELYNLTEDFSQARELANQYPEKLKELQLVFDQQARENNVYPMGVAAGNIRSPEWLSGREAYTYFGGFQGVPMVSLAAPDLTKSHRVTANVFVPPAGASGVILAAGGRDGGVALYIKEQHVIFESNYFNRERTIIRTSETLPTGEVKLEYEIKHEKIDGSGNSLVSIYIDGRLAEEGRLPNAPVPQVLDCFDVGQDSAAPVSIDYRPPFKFTGIIRKINVQLRSNDGS